MLNVKKCTWRGEKIEIKRFYIKTREREKNLFSLAEKNIRLENWEDN